MNEAIGIIEKLAGRPVAVDRRPAVLGDVPHTWADTTRARTELGWEPRTPLDDGLAAHLEAVRAEG